MAYAHLQSGEVLALQGESRVVVSDYVWCSLLEPELPPEWMVQVEIIGARIDGVVSLSAQRIIVG